MILKSVVKLFILVFCFCSFSYGLKYAPLDRYGRCEPLGEESICSTLGYNEAHFPNLLHDTSQEGAAMRFSNYIPLIKFGKTCGPLIHRFLCYVILPPCAREDSRTYKVAVPPCRRICQLAKSACEALMAKFGFSWPLDLKCRQFPVSGLCIQDNSTLSLSLPPATPPQPLPGQHIQFECPARLKFKGFRLHFSNYTVHNCGAPCRNFLWHNKDELHFAHVWIGAWSIICFINTLFTLLTFLVDRQRFRYPERCVIMIAVCYMLVSLVFVIGFITNGAVACRQSIQNVDNLILQGSQWEFCTVTFMLMYFFSMASACWWVCLGVSWFLSGSLKWSHEAVSNHSQWFHLTAWALPALQTIGVLALGYVEGDPLSGTCSIGLYNLTALKFFVILPLVVYLAVGLLFMTVCFISLLRTRFIMKSEGTWRTDKLERLMLRMGLFAVLYVISDSAVIACHFHDLRHLPAWMTGWHSRVCRDVQFGPLPCPSAKEPSAQPDFSVAMVRYLMTLSIGISASFWVYTAKTFRSWRAVICPSSRSTTHSKIQFQQARTQQLAITESGAATNIRSQQQVVTKTITAVPANITGYEVTNQRLPGHVHVPVTGVATTSDVRLVDNNRSNFAELPNASPSSHRKAK